MRSSGRRRLDCGGQIGLRVVGRNGRLTLALVTAGRTVFAFPVSTRFSVFVAVLHLAVSVIRAAGPLTVAAVIVALSAIIFTG